MNTTPYQGNTTEGDEMSGTCSKQGIISIQGSDVKIARKETTSETKKKKTKLGVQPGFIWVGTGRNGGLFWRNFCVPQNVGNFLAG